MKYGGKFSRSLYVLRNVKSEIESQGNDIFKDMGVNDKRKRERGDF